MRADRAELSELESAKRAFIQRRQDEPQGTFPLAGSFLRSGLHSGLFVRKWVGNLNYQSF